MKMTNKRKSQQDKLRRKFGWKTTNRFGWTSLIKEKADVYWYSLKYASNDIAITFNDLLLWQEVLGTSCGKGVTINIRQYNDSTEEAEFLNSLSVTLTFEELETIYKIAREKRYETIVKHYATQEKKEN